MDNKVTQLLTSSIKNPTKVGVTSFILGAAASAGVNYILNRRRNINTYFELPIESGIGEEELLLVTELSETLATIELKDQETYDALTEEEVEELPVIPISVIELGEDFVEKKMEEPVIIIPEAPEIVEPEHRSIFAGSNDEWNYEEEIAKRSEADPYIIHLDEFFENGDNYTQTSLIYYVGDDIMVDEKEKPLYGHHLVTGDLVFGHGSGDPNVVYIRNDKLKAEYEIFKHDGSYAIDVLGGEVEDEYQSRDLRHSHHTPRFYKD